MSRFAVISPHNRPQAIRDVAPNRQNVWSARLFVVYYTHYSWEQADETFS